MARRSARRYSAAPSFARRRRRGGGGGGGGGAGIGLNISGIKTAAYHGAAALIGLTVPTAIIRKISASMDANNFLVYTPEKPWGNIAAHAAIAILGGIGIRKATRSTSLAATFAGAAIARPLSALIMSKVDPHNEYGLGDDQTFFLPAGMGADFQLNQGMGADFTDVPAQMG